MPQLPTMSKRTIASFFNKVPGESASKKPRLSPPLVPDAPPTAHPSYPHPIASLPTSLLTLFDASPPPAPRIITKPDLSIAHYNHFFPQSTARQLYLFLRRSLPFYRVTYTIRRDSLDTTVRTPRYTTVFGVDAHSYFSDDDARTLLDSKTHKAVSGDRYRGCVCPPRPIPACLEVLKNLVERETGDTFNFILVNYYASSADSIAYHSDDETFLGPNPTIASLSLGTTRDFLMKHKSDKTQTLKLPLTNGELLVMRGATQRKWLHSIPKRTATTTGTWTSGGRINITFRNGRSPACTQNYYRYNVGAGPVYRWHDARDEMVLHTEINSDNTNQDVPAAVTVAATSVDAGTAAAEVTDIPSISAAPNTTNQPADGELDVAP
ncbi:hypothetical protein Dda_7384 [Drechslerella dactyloides]|uniref:Fe2OG dioxygenase domain-containing protein n=1 Tax=Drechslerella dactyloides TaxID=74499 RepID=A0AAD6IS25_DREDA|nr:hypothetical protein Dda_7384 [Drechslerella dactyloides]